MDNEQGLAYLIAGIILSIVKVVKMLKSKDKKKDGA